MRKLFLSLLFPALLAAQTPVAIVNPSFESNPPTGNYNIFTQPTGWHCTGGYYGMLNPTAAQIPAVPDGKTVLWLQNSECKQDLGIPAKPNTVYVFKYYVGSQALFPVPAVYSANVLIGTDLIPGCILSGAPPTVRDIQVQQTLVCTTGPTVLPGNLFVSLGSGPNQTIFDNVSLTSNPVGPLPPIVWAMPGLGTVTFPMYDAPACKPEDGNCSIQIQVCDTRGNCMVGQLGTLSLLKRVELPTPQTFTITVATVTQP